MKDNHPYLVNIDLMIQVQIPADIDPHSEDGMAYIRAAIGERIANNKAFEWLMENIGEIRPDKEAGQDAPEQQVHVFRYVNSRTRRLPALEYLGSCPMNNESICEAMGIETVSESQQLLTEYSSVNPLGPHIYMVAKRSQDLTDEERELIIKFKPEEIATEREAYREGQIAWVSHEAGNPVANTFPKGSPQHTAWNRGFNVGA